MADNRVNIVISAKDQASGPLKDVSREIEKTGDSVQRSSGLVDSLKDSLVGATKVLGLAAFAAGSAATVIGFNFNSSVEQAETKLMAFMKDGEQVAKTLAWVKEEAAATQFSFTDMADAAANLTPVAKTSGQSLESLVKQAEILAALNPTEGLTGATFALREALSGDWVSIVDRFNLPRKRINELKEQGVPAMEIISKTLEEMGIDYSLVAEQGKTTAARFDQLKDKLVMMAGAAAKPIFDRVSESLGKLGDFDFTALGDQMAGVVTGALDTWDEFILKVQEVGRQVWDYLGPKFQNLWESIQQNLIPALTDLWHNVIEPLLPVLGELLVGAIGLVVDILKIAVDSFGYVYDKLKEGDPFWWGLIGLLGTVAGALALSAGFTAFNAGMAFIMNSTIPAVMLRFGALASLISAPIVMPAIVIAAAIASLIAVQQEAKRTMQAVDAALDAEISANNADAELNRRARDYWRNPSASASQKSWAKKQLGLAIGSSYAQGGMTLVGEHGPEMVNLPQGAQVTPAWKTRSEGVSAAQGGISLNFYGPVTTAHDNDIERLAQRVVSLIDRSGQSVARGLTA